MFKKLTISLPFKGIFHRKKLFIEIFSTKSKFGERRDYIEVLKTRHGKKVGDFEIFYDPTTKTYKTPTTGPEIAAERAMERQIISGECEQTMIG